VQKLIDNNIDASQGSEVLQLAEVSNEDEEIEHPVTDRGYTLEEIPQTLKQTIKSVENVEELTAENVELYEVDFELLKLNGNNVYVINTKTGKLYKLEGVEYNQKIHHVPNTGIASNGEIVEDEEQGGNEDEDVVQELVDFQIEAIYNEDDEELQVNVVETETLNVEYEYHIKEKTIDEETGDAIDTSQEELVVRNAEMFYANETVEDGTYRVYVVIYDEANNSKKSTNEEIVIVEKPEVVDTITNLTASSPFVVTIGKTGTIAIYDQNEEKISNTSFNWGIQDASVATINTKGKVTGKKLETTTAIAALKTDTTQNIQITVEVKDLITEIYTKEDLKEFSDNVNSGNTYSGLTVTQMKDIDLEGNGENQWIAIGTKDKPFKGTYNGNGHEITGLYINTTEPRQGLFGYATSATIKNANVVNGYVYTTNFAAGGILGGGLGITIDNCTFSGSVETTGRNSTTYNYGMTGGIVGYLNYKNNNKVINCKNYGTVTSAYILTGGIVGFMQKGEITNCYNEGAITSVRRNIGGITGQIGYGEYKTKGTITKCVNNGIIQGTGSTAGVVGGIAGNITYGSKISECANLANVTTEGIHESYAIIGGIAGWQNNIGANIIEKCYNTGNVTSTTSRGSGGIVGVARTNANNTVTYCYNTGSVTGTTNVGQIFGFYNNTVQNDNYYSGTNVASSSSPVITNKGTQIDVNNLLTLDVWKDFLVEDKTPNINKGYPIFNWQ